MISCRRPPPATKGVIDNEGVIDEYQLIVCPIVLVEGRRLFDEHVAPGEMHLVSTRSFDRGTVLLSYSGAMVAAAAK